MKTFEINVICKKCRSTDIEQILSVKTNEQGFVSPSLKYICRKCKAEKVMV